MRVWKPAKPFLDELSKFKSVETFCSHYGFNPDCITEWVAGIRTISEVTVSYIANKMCKVEADIAI